MFSRLKELMLNMPVAAGGNMWVESTWNVQTNMDENKHAAIECLFEAVEELEHLKDTHGLQFWLDKAPGLSGVWVFHMSVKYTKTYDIPLWPATINDWEARVNSLRNTIIFE